MKQMRFRKKPVEIEAEHFPDAHGWGEGAMFMEYPIKHDSIGYYLEIPTLEGVHRANAGDWIITGVKGERYPCKPDIFEKTYEAVEEPKGETT